MLILLIIYLCIILITIADIIKNFLVLKYKKIEISNKKVDIYSLNEHIELKDGVWLKDKFVYIRYKKAFFNFLLFSFVNVFISGFSIGLFSFIFTNTLEAKEYLNNSYYILIFLIITLGVISLTTYVVMVSKSSLHEYQKKFNTEQTELSMYKNVFGVQNGENIYKFSKLSNELNNRIKWFSGNQNSAYYLKYELLLKVDICINYTNDKYKESIIDLFEKEYEEISELIQVLEELLELFDELSFEKDRDKLKYLENMYISIVNYLIKTINIEITKSENTVKTTEQNKFEQKIKQLLKK